MSNSKPLHLGHVYAAANKLTMARFCWVASQLGNVEVSTRNVSVFSFRLDDT
jgi:hypothetical protein